jgi:hypothetical protein
MVMGDLRRASAQRHLDEESNRVRCEGNVQECYKGRYVMHA